MEAAGKNVSPDRSSAGHGRFIFAGLMILLAWAPVPLGSNRPWAWALLEMGAFSLLAAWLLGRPGPPAALRAARIPVLLLLLWLAATGLQAVPIPAGVLAAISPAGMGARQLAMAAPDPSWAPVSVDAGATVVELLKRAAYVAVFILTLALADRPGRLAAMAAVLATAGFAQAMYGLVNTLSGWEWLLVSPKEHYRGYVTGTFVNRNHFAGHMELTLPLALGLLMAGLPRLGYSPTWRIFARNAVTMLSGAWGRTLFFCIVMFAGLFLSASRGGVASFFAAIVSVYLVFFALRGAWTMEGKFAPVILLLAVIASGWLGLGRLPVRYESTDILSESRPKVWEDCLPMLRDYAVTGSGAGTFKSIYPLYQNKNTSPLFFDHAHNDYIESLAENGAPACALLLGMVAISLFRLTGGFFKRRDPLMRGIIFASLAGTISLLLHSMVDFNFQIPANAMYFYALLGMGLAACHVPSHARRGRDREGRPLRQEEPEGPPAA